MILFASPSKF